MRSMFVTAALVGSLMLLAPLALADPVEISGPHPDANGGATCSDVTLVGVHVGGCEGAPSCPLYYDDSLGLNGCLPTPPVDVSFLPSFGVYAVHSDGSGGPAQCGDVFADGSHLGFCAGNPGCPVYYDDYAGLKGCVL